mgnify:CR=1 FL=1
MTCKDCIHEEVCDQSSRRMWSAMSGETECSDFKNKADFVEVVRCKDCKYFACYNPNDKYCMFGNALSVSNDNSYCGYGESK